MNVVWRQSMVAVACAGMAAGCIHPAAPGEMATGPGKPVGVTSMAVPLESLATVARKGMNAVVAPVPKPGGFSGTQFRYAAKRQQEAAAEQARALKPQPARDEGSNAGAKPATLSPSA